jgi:hypothetical protein
MFIRRGWYERVGARRRYARACMVLRCVQPNSGSHACVHPCCCGGYARAACAHTDTYTRTHAARTHRLAAPRVFIRGGCVPSDAMRRCAYRRCCFCGKCCLCIGTPRSAPKQVGTSQRRARTVRRSASAARPAGRTAAIWPARTRPTRSSTFDLPLHPPTARHALAQGDFGRLRPGPSVSSRKTTFESNVVLCTGRRPPRGRHPQILVRARVGASAPTGRRVCTHPPCSVSRFRETIGALQRCRGAIPVPTLAPATRRRATTRLGDAAAERGFAASPWPADRDALWWRGGAAVDADVAARFGADLEAAARGELDEAWGHPARGRPLDTLAGVILCDQFSRWVGAVC